MPVAAITPTGRLDGRSVRKVRTSGQPLRPDAPETRSPRRVNGSVPPLPGPPGPAPTVGPGSPAPAPPCSRTGRRRTATRSPSTAPPSASVAVRAGRAVAGKSCKAGQTRGPKSLPSVKNRSASTNHDDHAVPRRAGVRRPMCDRQRDTGCAPKQALERLGSPDCTGSSSETGAWMHAKRTNRRRCPVLGVHAFAPVHLGAVERVSTPCRGPAQGWSVSSYEQ